MQLLIKVVAEQLFAVHGIRAARRGFLDMVRVLCMNVQAWCSLVLNQVLHCMCALLPRPILVYPCAGQQFPSEVFVPLGGAFAARRPLPIHCSHASLRAACAHYVCR